MKNTMMIRIMIAGMLICCLLVGCQADASTTAPEENTVTGPATVEAYGMVQIRNHENITIEVPGRITSVNVINGQSVKKGDVLFVMDIEGYMSDLSRKELELGVKEQELKLMVNPMDDVTSSLELSTEEQIAAKKLELSNLNTLYSDLNKAITSGDDADLMTALLNLDYAEKQLAIEQEAYEGSKSLFDAGIISQNDLDIAATKLESAKLTYDTGVLTYDKLLKGLGTEKNTVAQQIKTTQSLINSLEGEQEQSSLKYELKQLEIDLLAQELTEMNDKLVNGSINEQGEVICKMEQGIFDGFNLVVGDIITGSAGAATYSLYNPASIEVFSKVSEDFISQIFVGQKVNITPVSARDQVIQGEVTDIAQLAYQEGGEAVIPVRIKFDDQSGVLKLNYNVDVAFILE